MGLYSNLIFPWLLELTMSAPQLVEYRKQVLSEVSGEVLEIGFGTGANLPYYPQTVERLTTVDSNAAVNKLAQNRIEACQITIDNRVLNGENLPMEDESFDNVVSTWTLCSIAQVEQAIAEIYRVLKPGGRFFFIEHGLSNESSVQVWQNRLTPLQKIIGDGCHLNRNIKQIIEKKFITVSLEEFYAPNIPQSYGYMYKGVATK